VVNEAVAVTALYGQPREACTGTCLSGSNFVMEGMLQDHRDELATAALPEEMDAAMKRTTAFFEDTGGEGDDYPSRCGAEWAFRGRARGESGRA